MKPGTETTGSDRGENVSRKSAGEIRPDATGRADPLRILLVTLPYGPFGRLLNLALRRRGAETRHMIFNAGDMTSLRGPGGVRFVGSPDDWRAALPKRLSGFSDVVIFGESGPYNRALLDMPKSDRPRLWVLENGYFRPHWITLERDGANHGGRLPRSANAYEAPAPAASETRPVGSGGAGLVLNISVYYLAEFLGRPLFPAYRTGFFISPAKQALAHARRWLTGLGRRRDREEGRALGAGSPWFLVCLQRDGDSQIVRHSDYRSNAEFLDAVVASFASSAPTSARLVVKNHPLDPGVTDMAGAVRRLARAHGVAGRVDFIEGGRLAVLCDAAQGVVVNNSSAGYAALGFGAPVKALGRAVYDFEGLCDQQPLDGFWREPVAPDPALFARFRAHVLANTQINGSFDARTMRGETAEQVASAICAPPSSQM